jgi:tryptophan 2,3-dioxygenase
MQRRSVWDSTLIYLESRGHKMPAEVMTRDVSVGYTDHAGVQDVLLDVHRNDAEAAMICEALVDLDEGLQEWRYRHVKMVERTIGHKMGSGGSSGVGYLSSTLFRPVFGDLWAIRSRF